MRIVNIVGARPNFVKIAPLIREMRRRPRIVPVLVHTGQHYDGPMSEQFFTELEIRPPDFNLGVGSGSHAVQTAQVMQRLESILDTMRPDLVLVVGDVNSTLAAALTAVVYKQGFTRADPPHLMILFSVTACLSLLFLLLPDPASLQAILRAVRVA